MVIREDIESPEFRKVRSGETRRLYKAVCNRTSKTSSWNRKATNQQTDYTRVDELVKSQDPER
uniref:Uncharacterized protein n=1 Tax=Oryza glumipatula TaxID=40148 RepID=A0A0D9YES7_9ORYZ